MFSDLLEAVESNYLDANMKLTPEQHKELLDEIRLWLSIDSEPLIGATKALFGEGIFDISALGFETTQKNHFPKNKTQQNQHPKSPPSRESQFLSIHREKPPPGFLSANPFGLTTRP